MSFKKNNQYWIYGFHAVSSALSTGRRKVFSVISTQNAANRLDYGLKQEFTNIIKILKPEEISAALPKGVVHQGIAALVEPLEEMSIDDLLTDVEEEEKVLLIALDQVTDPHNVGAIIRSAAAFGASGIILTERNSPEQTATVVKSSAGTIEFMSVVREVNLANTIRKLKKSGFFCAGLAGEATTLLADFDPPNKLVLILGSEGDGLRRLTKEECDYLIKIPMCEGVESLNVSNAAAVSMYELSKKMSEN